MNTEDQKLLHKLIVRQRARNACEHCGAKQGEYNVQDRKITKVKVTVCHLDLDENNNLASNLAALCQECKDAAENAEQERRDKANGGSVQRRLI